MNNAAIGVFDSGVGGLTCVEELARLMPHENIIYLGDTARMPYGTRSSETLVKYAKEDIAFMQKHDVKMLLIACGTVSSVVMSHSVFDNTAIKEYSGVVLPAAHAACAATRNKRIGVIATGATIKSGSYGRVIRAIDPQMKVVGKACPMFVQLVENGYTSPENPAVKFFAQEYLECMKKERVDTLILGCTHFPHLSEVISQVMGEGVRLISSGAELAKYALRTMTSSDSLADRESLGKIELYCTDSEQLFAENVEKFLGKNINAEISKCSLKMQL